MLFPHIDYSALELRTLASALQTPAGPRMCTGRFQSARPVEYVMVGGRFVRGRRGPDGIWRRDNS